MSKLDRFLVSESLIRDYPSISSVALERYLSDHRPIFLRESRHDYGPVPFKLYHFWFEIEGFDKFVEDSWKNIHVTDHNDYLCLLRKLKALKESIKGWITLYRERKLNELSNPLYVKNEFYDHFKHRFEKSNMCNIKLDREFSNCINAEQVADLERECTKEEIKVAVWDCGTDKTPGPDGFTFGFYRRYWNLIEGDVVRAVKWFFHHGRIPNGGNSSFITLIPKVPNANMVKDFRPISLIGSVYKIVAKILANRLAMVIDYLVSDTQSAFVKDRQILDGPFILNEVVQWCKRKGRQVMFFKVDFEKAFDSVRWEFVIDILRKFGVGDKWCQWIHSCLRSSRGSILVNGSPTGEFQFFKGLKQGDPLSPFLFILVMEGLHVSFQRVVDAGMFKGIMLNNSTCVSHLFYADDAIFMGQWTQANIDIIIRVLKVFHIASGLRINMKKSKLMGLGVDTLRVEHAIQQIGCMALKLPFKYLGSMVGGRMTRTNEWTEVVNAMVNRLSKWKLKTISIGGRLTLLKSVLGSSPIYYMSMYKVPMTVLHNNEVIRC
ncbi:RNA-directed DNA polymerase, eukaryota [Tanacetum coccineum]